MKKLSKKEMKEINGGAESGKSLSPDTMQKNGAAAVDRKTGIAYGTVYQRGDLVLVYTPKGGQILGHGTANNYKTRRN